MTVKEFYEKIPSTSRNILGTINTNLMGNLWTPDATLIGRLSIILFGYNFQKDMNPVVEVLCEISNIDIDNLTASNMTTIWGLLYSKYIDKWTKLYNNVYKATYNPIWNVEGTEQTVHTFEHGKQVEETKNFTITMNKGSTDTETVTNNITDNDVYAFDSSSPVGASKSTNNGSRTNVGSGFDSDVHTGTDTFKNSGCDTERTTLTRGLNLGMMSTQDLLTQEIELREKFNYYSIVINDIIRELAINIY